ncbi:MAG: hybrid sensor histidine kinase/response regulator [Oligoflexia bacterium]|nr:hybrid sensor histidine kinase/response regulator [Oligoflexia bacterium]
MEHRKPRVYIVDDMKVNIMILEKALAKDQYDVFSFTDPVEALSMMEEILPDVFLLDVEMDKLNGFDFCSRIRQHPILKDAPVIFITSLDDTESLERALAVGGTEFLNKDVNPYELKLRINNILHLCFLTKELKEQSNLLAQKSDSYRVLVRLLCHDIANPLTMQNLYLEKMMNTPHYHTEGSIKKAIDSINKSQMQIISIIEHVRQISAMEDGKFVLNLSPVKIAEIFDEVAFTFESSLQNKNVELKFSNQCPQDLCVMVEKTSFTHQVIANLISNALKFSFPGRKINVDCSLGSGNSNEQKDRVIITVADSGIGIPKKMIEDLFKAHVKTTRVGTGKEKGTGFGLPLVKNYLEKYGGTIRVDSKSQEDGYEESVCGTTFTLSLKRA